MRSRAPSGSSIWFSTPVDFVKKSGGPARWYLIRGQGEAEHIVLETSRPAPTWPFYPDFPGKDDDRFVPRFIAEIARPWLIEGWSQDDPSYIAGLLTENGPDSPVYVDVASTDQEYLEWWFVRGAGPILDTAKIRKRPEMMARIDLAHALRYWDEGDDWVLTDTLTRWADQTLETLGERNRTSVTAQLRWGTAADLQARSSSGDRERAGR
jgi:hypothetical protein